ncbi:S8 family peptidase [Salinimicrobium gaetbulicola]|uniref:S8 family serine peptidase n=1 Tax=Salinimicrobium gaetbulicola TaxID=999702 RepID=A0ABW3IFN5_9FLAO
MTKKVGFFKMSFSALVIGLILISCQSEDIQEEVKPVAAELEEPPFKNYMVITESDQMSKSTESFLEVSGDVVKSIPQIGVAVVSSNDLHFVKNTLKNKEIVSVVPDYEIKWIPSAEYFESEYEEVGAAENAVGEYAFGEPVYYMQRLWGMEAIEAPQAWAKGYTGMGATVFVLDSGIDAEHPDLAGNLNTELSESFYPDEDWNIQPGFYFNHGTHVAGTIAATNNLRLIGVAPHAELVAVKVLSEVTGSGSFSTINEGIVYAADNGADVINMSLGATLNKNGWLVDADGNKFHIPAKYIAEIVLAQQRAINYAYSKGATIIASAGNDGVNYDGNEAYVKLPGGLNNVITISATAPEGYLSYPDVSFDVPASYTNHGRSLVDLAAPGGDFDLVYSDGSVYPYDMVWSTISNGWGYSAGTSMAAPHASGVAALIIAGNGGQMAPHEVLKQLINSADQPDGDGQSVFLGNGSINANFAVGQ